MNDPHVRPVRPVRPVSVADVVLEMPSAAVAIVDRVFPVWCAQRRLTPCEARLVRAAVDGRSLRCELAEVLGVKLTTVRFHTLNILRKTSARTMRDVVVLVLREALASASAGMKGERRP